MVLNTDVWQRVMNRLSEFQTDDDVAAFLQAEGVVAIPAKAEECALAVWVKSQVGENKTVVVDGGKIRVHETIEKTWADTDEDYNEWLDTQGWNEVPDRYPLYTWQPIPEVNQ